MKNLVAVAWDGVSEPCNNFFFDKEPTFEIVLFDYSGSVGAARDQHGRAIVSIKTECKGQIYWNLSQVLADRFSEIQYIGLLDDDILVRISDLDYLLHIAQRLQLDSFAPSLSHSSFHSWPHTLHMPGKLLHWVPWVETMMPFYRSRLFQLGAPFYPHSISSWGICSYALPLCQQVGKLTRVAVIDAVQAHHIRPVTSGNKVYSNGLTAAQEKTRMREICIEWIAAHQPELFETEWYKQIFAEPAKPVVIPTQ